MSPRTNEHVRFESEPTRTMRDRAFALLSRLRLFVTMKWINFTRTRKPRMRRAQTGMAQNSGRSASKTSRSSRRRELQSDNESEEEEPGTSMFKSYTDSSKRDIRHLQSLRLAEFKVPERQRIKHMRFSPSGRWLVVCGRYTCHIYDHTVRVSPSQGLGNLSSTVSTRRGRSMLSSS